MRGKSVLRWAGALALLVSAREVVDEPPYADGPGTWDYFF